jgi:hypothetical protein
MKYAVSTENETAEFGTYEEAEQYAIQHGVDVGSIATLPDEPVVDPVSSIETYEERVAAGYPIPNTPYFLAMQDSDRAQFSGMLVLIRELLDAGYITNDTTQSIKTSDNTIMEITTAEFRQLMIGYGIYYKTVWNECAPVST